MQAASNQPYHVITISGSRPPIETHEPTQNLIKDLNLKVIRLYHVNEIYPLIADSKVPMDLISIDLEDLYSVEGIGMWEIIHTLATLIKSTIYINMHSKAVKRNTKINVAVKKNTDLKLIRDAISNVDIVGLYARADEFNYEEAKQSMIDCLDGKNHVPKYIQERLHPKKKAVSKVIVSKDQIKLTTRQNQILDMVANRGASNKMIAKTLNISESTVKLHVGTILKKFGARNRTQLAIFGKNYNTQVQV